MVYVIATAELKPGTRGAFLQEFHRNVPNVRAEKGCIGYGPTVDVPAASRVRSRCGNTS